MERLTERGARRLPVAPVVLAAVALVLGAAGAALPHSSLWHSDEGAKFLQLLNLHLGPDGLQAAIAYPGRSADPGLQFVPFHPKQYHVDAAGQIHLQWPVFLALLTWPWYTLLGIVGLYVLPFAGLIAACWATYRLARAVGAPATRAWIAIPLLGLGTPTGFYGWVFFEHTLAAALVALAVLGLVTSLPAARLRRLFAAGAALGAAIYLRSELYVLVVALGLVLAGWWLQARAGAAGGGRLRAGATVLSGLVVALLPLWSYYFATAGGPLPQHATWYFDSAEAPVPAPGPRLPEVRYLAHAGPGILPDFLAGPAIPDAPALPAWAPAALLAGLLALVLARALPALAARLRSRVTQAGESGGPVSVLVLLGLALLAAGSLPGLLDPAPYTNLHGFLLAAPLVAGAVLARPAPGAGGAALRLLAAVTALYLVLHVGIISALSGLGPISRYEWGQRYLLPAYPLLIALVVAAVTSPRPVASPGETRSSGRARYATALLLGLLFLIGAGYLARGWGVLQAERRRNADWQAAVAAVPDRAIITDNWWLPLLLAPEFYRHTWFLAGPANAALWPARAQQAGLFGFSTVTLGPALGAALSQARPPPTPGPANTGQGLTIQHFAIPR